jgi:hypothetical protein
LQSFSPHRSSSIVRPPARWRRAGRCLLSRPFWAVGPFYRLPGLACRRVARSLGRLRHSYFIYIHTLVRCAFVLGRKASGLVFSLIDLRSRPSCLFSSALHFACVLILIIYTLRRPKAPAQRAPLFKFGFCMLWALCRAVPKRGAARGGVRAIGCPQH